MAKVGPAKVSMLAWNAMSRRSRRSEYALSEKAAEILRENRHVFVLCSSTNIDSIASFYKAAGKVRRLVVADRYQRLNKPTQLCCQAWRLRI